MKGRKKVKIIIGVIVFVVIGILIIAVLCHISLTSRQTRSKWGNTTEIESSMQYELWFEDIEYLVKNLEDKHKNLYHSISQEELRQEVQLFKEDIINLTDIGKIIRIQSIVAKIGDGHTWVAHDIPLNWFPVAFKKFEDGIYVISCAKQYEEILGTRVVGINGISIEDIVLDMSEMVSHDNEIQLSSNALFIVRCADYLKHYDIIDKIDNTVFEFETDADEHVNVAMDSYYDKDSSLDWINITDKYKNIENILYTRNINDIYWYEYFPEERLVYFQYNRCFNNEETPINEFISELLAFLKDNNVERFVFDIRNNGGGNSSIIEPLIYGLANNQTINKYGNLFVVIGNSTYSSAILNAIKLSQETNAILIGEPTGGMPNHYGDVRSFNLPNSGLTVFYSTKYFQPSEADEDSIYPDIDINYMFEEFTSGIDPVMREILELAR